MKILLLCTKFLHDDGSLWLPSELSNALSESGHEVTVINLQWSGGTPPTNKINSNIHYLHYSAFRTAHPKSLSVASRWILSSLKPLFFLLREIIFRKNYDLLICFSPCTALYAAIPFARSISNNSCLLYWDFFPIHNQEISNKAPKFSLPILKFIENLLIKKFNMIGLMSEANLSFFKKYFKTDKKNTLSIVPLWTSHLDNSSSDNESFDFLSKGQTRTHEIKFIFGGQLVEGRGIIELCHAMLEASQKNPDISLTIFGAGILLDKILDFHKNYPNTIIYGGQLTREDYLKKLKIFDVGVIATVPNVNTPTFPSKCLDYMASSLPILASVEKASDFGILIENNQAGISCNAGELDNLTKSILKLASSKNERIRMGRNGNLYLRKNHSISSAIQSIIGSKNV